MTIPEQAKPTIIKMRRAGMGWTALRNWLEEEYGIEVHRSTIQRWYDREGYSDGNDLDYEGVAYAAATKMADTIAPEPTDPLEDPDFWVEEKVKQDKKVATHKAEAAYYKKLYESSIKDSSKKELIIDAIRDNTSAIPKVTRINHKTPSRDTRRRGTKPAHRPVRAAPNQTRRERFGMDSGGQAGGRGAKRFLAHRPRLHTQQCATRGDTANFGHARQTKVGRLRDQGGKKGAFVGGRWLFLFRHGHRDPGKNAHKACESGAWQSRHGQPFPGMQCRRVPIGTRRHAQPRKEHRIQKARSSVVRLFAWPEQASLLSMLRIRHG